MSRSLLRGWIAAVIFFSVIDVLVTYLLLSAGHIEEINPLPQWMIRSFGVEMALLFFSPLITLTSLFIVIWGCRKMIGKSIVGGAVPVFQKTRRRAYFYLILVLLVKVAIAAVLLWYLITFLLAH